MGEGPFCVHALNRQRFAVLTCSHRIKEVL